MEPTVPKTLWVDTTTAHNEPLCRALQSAGIAFESRDNAEYSLVAARGTRPETVLALWSKKQAADLIVASRRSGRRLRDRLIRRILSLPYFDYSSGVRLYRQAALRRVKATPTNHLDSLVRLHCDGYRIREVPVDSRPNNKGSGVAAALALLRLRHARSAADADERQFESRRPFLARRLKRRLEHTVSFLEVDVPLLDVGCGSGKLIQGIAKGVGVDIDVAKLRYLRGRAKALGVAATITSLPFRDGTFPQLVCTGVGPGAVDDGAIPELKRVLRAGGTLIVGASDEGELRPRLEASGFAIDEVQRIARDEVLVRAVRHRDHPSKT